MCRARDAISCTVAAALALLLPFAAESSAIACSDGVAGGEADPVVAHIHGHWPGADRPIVLSVGAGDFPPEVWQRVRNLVAFRLFRRLPDGTSAVDSAIYL